MCSRFHRCALVSTAMANRFVEVFGEEKGVGCRATIGVQSLASNFCFETWIEVEIKVDPFAAMR